MRPMAGGFIHLGGQNSRHYTATPTRPGSGTALITKNSTLPASDMSRQAFDRIKGAISESHYSTEVGLKEPGRDGSIAFAPSVCA